MIKIVKNFLHPLIKTAVNQKISDHTKLIGQNQQTEICECIMHCLVKIVNIILLRSKYIIVYIS
jgi:hypothetical protein